MLSESEREEHVQRSRRRRRRKVLDPPSPDSHCSSSQQQYHHRRRRRPATTLPLDEEHSHMYGRLEVLRTSHIPCRHLTERPLRRADSPMAPISFLLEPHLMHSLRDSLLRQDSRGKATFERLAKQRLGISHSFCSDDREEMRIVLKKIDSRMFPIQPATLDGIHRMLQKVHYQLSTIQMLKISILVTISTLCILRSEDRG